MGGMAALFLPSPEENDKVTEKVMADKMLETQNGHDELGLLTLDYLILPTMSFPTLLRQAIPIKCMCSGRG